MLKKARILVVDDDPDVLTAVRLLLKTEAGEVIAEKNPENLRSLLSREKYDVILLDMNFRSTLHTGNEGFYWLRHIREASPGTAVVMITAYGDIDLAVRSLKEGASDFIVKPWRNEKMLDTLEETLAKKSGVKNAAQSSDSNLLGASQAMQEVMYKVNKIAPTDANVLILGENGTGKELVAQAIHQHSLRAAKPFVRVDLGSLTESLFESELFGSRKGAFTDSREDRMGRIEAAQGGTLFLDEIGNISLQQQAKLLSVLQDRQVIRLGDNTPIPIDIRLICATNVPVYELAAESRFRKDLIYRINTVEIMLPPLRQRGEDIVLLAREFATRYAAKYNRPIPEFDEKALDKLRHYAFPGNVRELQFCIERAVIMSDGGRLKAADLLFSPIEAGKPVTEDSQNLRLEEVEKNTILKVIEKNQGNITRAARELGITRTALYRRLGKYDL